MGAPVKLVDCAKTASSDNVIFDPRSHTAQNIDRDTVINKGVIPDYNIPGRGARVLNSEVIILEKNFLDEDMVPGTQIHSIIGVVDDPAVPEDHVAAFDPNSRLGPRMGGTPFDRDPFDHIIPSCQNHIRELSLPVEDHGCVAFAFKVYSLFKSH